jgi:hypothetical protein
MLGLLGLLGAVLAGFMVDAVTAPDRDDRQEGDEDEVDMGSLLDDPNAEHDPGAGADDFPLADIRLGDPVAQIVDFDRGEDALVLLYDAALHADPVVTVRTEAGDATVLLDGVPVAQVLGGAGLESGDVVMRAA